MSGIIAGFREQSFFENLRKTLIGKCRTSFVESSCDAGSEKQAVTLDGEGVVEAINVVFWGSSADVKHSRIVLESDGDRSELASPYEVGEVQMLEYGRWSQRMFLHKWDDANFAYGCYLEVSHGFKNGCVVKIKNGDHTNSVSFRVLILWRKLM